MIPEHLSAVSEGRCARRFPVTVGLLWGVGQVLLAWATLILMPVASAGIPETDSGRNAVDFGRDVRPILSAHCFACHGPDENDRQADLRLDTVEGLSYVVEPEDAEASEMMDRINQPDPDLLMPPPEYHKPLSAEQKKTLRDWIAGGAKFELHWAFVPPARSENPTGEEPNQLEQANDSKTNSSADSVSLLRQRVDQQIEHRLANLGLTPNPRADDRALLRRVCLDLTGLPPSREQLDDFVRDRSPDRYERLVDRLLASPAFGEHVGRHWLDLVRYADTHGLHLDNYREMWPYRDWVIDAINRNMPFDEFITKQLAGDLLDNATLADKVASGFNRLNLTTNEGGSIYDEVFARNCIDRTDAFGTIFLGLTTQCAVCHDHKFDPIKQSDYYSLLAFFNSIDGRALDGNQKDHAPSVAVPTPQQEAEESELQSELENLNWQMNSQIATVDQTQTAWEQTLGAPVDGEWHTLVPTEARSRESVELAIDEDGTVRLVGKPSAKDRLTIVAPLPPGKIWQTLRLEAIADEKTERVGASENGNAVLSEMRVRLRDGEDSSDWLPVPIEAAFASHEQSTAAFSISRVIDHKIDDESGWAVGGHQKTGNRSAWFFTPGLTSEAESSLVEIELVFESKHSQHQFLNVRFSIDDRPPVIPDDQKIILSQTHVMGPFEVEDADAGRYRNAVSVTQSPEFDQPTVYAGKEFHWQPTNGFPQVEVGSAERIADRASFVVIHRKITSPRDQNLQLLYDADDGLMIFLNGKELRRHLGLHTINPLTKQIDLPLKKGDNDLFLKMIDYGGDGRLSYAFRSLAVDTPASVREIAATPAESRTEATSKAIRKYFRVIACVHPDWISLRSEQLATLNQLESLRESMPVTLIWKELAEPRQARILNRGQYDDPGDEVERAVPSFLPPMPEGAPPNRLGLAQWLVRPDHPLTARVAANRLWQMLFGTGIVKTSEDFGSQGEVPSHPELLDHLAIEFIDSGWNVKALIRELVLSDAYTRDNRVSDQMKRIDPMNRFYARGPRHRLDAEVLRDQSLAVSDLLVECEGGPSVKPPQPRGLWKAVAYTDSDTATFVADQGDKIYRRSVYVFWKRTIAPPQMSTFDAPSRESCIARRERTNTPMQALLLMNEAMYLETARALAQRTLKVPDLDDEESRVSWMFETVTARLPSETERDEMLGLLADIGGYYESRPDLAGEFMKGMDPKHAAWTILASTILNLDEVVSK